MATQLRPLPRLAFGPFEVDPSAGELRKSGIRVRLAGQPFQILLLLLAQPGQVVTREQLREHIWGGGTFVDFEHSLSTAVNKLRRALGDSAENPRYVETIPGRGYRFIGAVQPESILQTATPVSGEFPPVSANSASKKTWFAAGALIGGVCVVSLVIWMALQKPTRREPRVHQLTTNSVDNPIYHAVISPQGNYLAYGDAAGIHIRVISTGESHLLPKPAALSADDVWFPVAWFPDGTRILAAAQGEVTSAWSIPLVAGTTYRLRDNVIPYSVSPDGSLIAFTAGNYLVSLHNRSSVMSSEIWVMGTRGENARRIIEAKPGTYFGSVQWSPDGKRIAYRKLSVFKQAFAEYTLETRDLAGGTPSVVVSSRETNYLLSFDAGSADNFCWTRDGRILYAVHEPAPNYRDRNLWAIDVNSKTGEARGRPRRVTNLTGYGMDGLSMTADGSRLMFESGSDQSNVLVARILPGGDLASPRRLTFDQRYNSPYAWTPDSKAVIFRSDRTGTYSVYKQALGEQEAELIPTGPESIRFVRVSPGGKWLIYATLANVSFHHQFELNRVMRVPLAGGAPELLAGSESAEVEVNVSCGVPAGAACVMSEADSKNSQIKFQRFDPANGRREALFQVAIIAEKRINWTISPDGLHIAVTGADPEGRIEIRSLTGRIERAIEMKGRPNPLFIDWAANSRAVYVEHFGLITSPSGPIGVTLLRVDLDGNVKPLWDTKAGRHAYAIPSPDGKYLAIRAPAVERNAWMIEDF